MTAAERLHQLAGFSGSAAALLLAIGAGPTAGAALVNYSGLTTGSAAEHLLAGHVAAGPLPACGPAGRIQGGGRTLRARRLRDEELVWVARGRP